jgi:metal-dependent amidase/aminoacylase/carboxypeptidase family protein
MAMIGAGSERSGAVHPHHSPMFEIDEAALPIGLEWLLRTAWAYLSGPSSRAESEDS